ncbi:Disp1 [Symbiodinium pilosum]|uniref:Disp1 protein n=1 Tax=Symbiodinium pilosum TaxID=2952 RepID=A0A812XVN2_SYMPI|nr:Disp1 [Symbiodinium pilosum]
MQQGAYVRPGMPAMQPAMPFAVGPAMQPQVPQMQSQMQPMPFVGSPWPQTSQPRAPTAFPPHWSAQTAGYNPAGDPLLSQSFGQSFGIGPSALQPSSWPPTQAAGEIAANAPQEDLAPGAHGDDGHDDHGRGGHGGHSGHGGHGHEMWLVQKIQASPWRFYFGGFCCLLSCFILIALLLLVGVPILDPRPNDIVPVILREHIAKKRQDAGRSIKEVALACPGCENLEERSERMFYLHILYEVEHESGTLWETDVLKGIRDVEQKIFEAKGLGPDGKDMCLLAKPDEQLKGLGRELPKTPKCAFALSPLLFLADKVSSSNVGSASQHLWLPCTLLQLASASMARLMVSAARCMLLSMLALTVMPGVFVTPPSGQVSKPCIRGSNISRMQRSEPPSNAGTMLMAVMAGVMVAVVSPASSWAGTGGARPDFQVARPGYMQGIDAALAATKPGEIDHRARLFEWYPNPASFFPQVVEELKREQVKLEAAPTKQERLEKNMKQMQEYAKTAVFQDAEVFMCFKSKRAKAVTSMARRAALKSVFSWTSRLLRLPLADPPPFQLKTDHLTRCVVPDKDVQKEEMGKVTGSWFMRKATEYYDKKLGQDPSEDFVDGWCTEASNHLPPEMRDCGCLALVYNDVQMALNWDISLQQMWDFETGFQKLMQAEAKKAEADAYVQKVLNYWTSDNAAHAFYARRRVMDRVIPHPFVMAAAWKITFQIGSYAVLHDDRRSAVAAGAGVSVKALHTLFFFGFPLRNINEHWTGLNAEKGRNEASDYIMEWIFNTYNDLLVDLNKQAKGFKMSFDANSLQNGSPLLKQYIAYNIPRDARWITASIMFMLAYISYTTGSVFLGVSIIAMIVFAFGPALLLYTMVFGQRYIGLLHLNGLFIILGVGVDDAFVIMDAYGQEKAEAEAEGRPTNFSAIMSPAVHHASKACLCTSLTTFFAFASNSVSDFPSIRTFGMFCACLILTNFFIDFSFFLAIVCADERLKRPKPAAPKPPVEEADTLRPMEKWFHDTFFLFVKTFKFPLLGVFAVWAAVCMWTATYVTPDPNMPKVFMPSDNYERFLPTLAKRYEKTFNPFRLKVRIHLGIDADDPINRGTTPDYNDCFFNCAGQRPNYLDLFATAGDKSEESKSKQIRMQRVVQKLCDVLDDASEWDGEASQLDGLQGEFPFLQVATAETLGGLPPLKCVFRDFEHWINMMNAAAKHSAGAEEMKEFPSSNFCCGVDSDFVKFLSSPMPPSNKMYQSGQRNMEFFQDEVFFDRVDGELVLRAIVIEVALKTTWQIPYLDGIELNRHWDKFVADFAQEEAKQEMLPMLPKAIFATDMFAFHWFQVQDAMNSEVFDGIKLSLFLAFLVLLGATQNLFLALISVSCIVAIVSSVLAFAVCMDWKTSVSEAIIYVMVIGLSVDYVIHLGDAYLECPDESREERVQFMVTKMGVSVISGAISSAGAAVFMTFCQSLFLIKFGIVICFVISVSVVTSLIFFSALLLIAGPSGESGSFAPILRWLGVLKKPVEPAQGDGDQPPEEPQKVQPRLYSSVVRYRKSLVRASVAHADAQQLARQLGVDNAEPAREIEMVAVPGSQEADSGGLSIVRERSEAASERPIAHEASEVVDLRDLRD